MPVGAECPSGDRAGLPVPPFYIPYAVLSTVRKEFRCRRRLTAVPVPGILRFKHPPLRLQPSSHCEQDLL
jgi:hypothetical protein